MSQSKFNHLGKGSPYNAYRVTSPGHETKVVFAAGIWSAVGILLQWRYANRIGEVQFTIDSSWAKSLTGTARQHIDQARAQCSQAGIGARYRAASGWAIGRRLDGRGDLV